MNIDYKSWSARSLIYSLVLLFTVIVMIDKFMERAADPARFEQRLDLMFYVLWGLNGLGLLLTALGWRNRTGLKKDINFILIGGGHLLALIGAFILYFSAV